jgi:uncharacterized delta-60 repeat protein
MTHGSFEQASLTVEALVMRFLVLVVVCAPLAGCWRVDPLFCDSQEDCADNGALTFCDLEGEYEASEHIARTCIAPPAAPVLTVTAAREPTFLRVGSSATISLTLMSDRMLDEEIVVTVSGAPPGVTFDALTVPASGNAAQLTAHAQSDVDLDAYQVTVEARAGDVEARTSTTLDIIGVAGTPDVTFGEGGSIVTAQFGRLVNGFRQDDSVVLVGANMLVRLRPNGMVDPTFGANGRAALDPLILGKMAVTFHAAAAMADGGFVVGGSSTYMNETSDAFLVWFTSQGFLDPTRPPRLVRPGNGDQAIVELAASPAGTLVAVLSQKPDGSNFTDYYLLRFDARGAVDTAFGQDGAVEAIYNSAVFIDRDEAVIEQYQDRLRKLDRAGAPVPSYGVNGELQLERPENATNVRYRADGSVFVIGRHDQAIAALLVTKDGAVDPSFGEAGFTSLARSTDEEEAGFDLWDSPDGKGYYGIGYIDQVGPYVQRLRLFHLDADGKPDGTYGPGGALTDNIQWDLFRAAVPLQPHRVLVLGFDEQVLKPRLTRYWY